ncbi:hypothetical protein TEA_016334 [Camellia sinensis var. sinensis]|uniref:C2 NT-type domain-containing protein n=1 Tax=Camellia sinensis var. sinensis TaxID=542762 RepID=A0A4S4DA99_CAMSN|nr:hypothetical protein TEA_016334 [Camellia sinensis var. sinensis]
MGQALCSLLSTETGKTVSKSGKASVRNGTCQWTETLSESVWISQDEALKEFEQYLFQLVVSMVDAYVDCHCGSARSNILGEATINLAGYMSSRASIPVSLPLKKCNHGTILQVEIQCLTPRTKSRDMSSTFQMVLGQLIAFVYHMMMEALNKIISHWNLGTKLNFSGVDPCTQNATWAPDSANPQIACHCTGTTCHVTRLKIYALDISGEIPNELFMLKELQNLNLAQNVLSGPIPPEIGQLTNMNYLSFAWCLLALTRKQSFNHILEQWGRKIYALDISGEIPNELFMLKELQNLNLAQNVLSGPIPPEIGQLTNMNYLSFAWFLLALTRKQSFNHILEQWGRREGYNETEIVQLLSQTHIQSLSSLRPGQFVNESEISMLHMFSPSSNYQVQYLSSSSNGGQIGATTGGNHLSLSMSNNQQRPFINPPQLFATAAASSGFLQQITTRPQNWLH